MKGCYSLEGCTYTSAQVAEVNARLIEQASLAKIAAQAVLVEARKAQGVVIPDAGEERMCNPVIGVTKNMD